MAALNETDLAFLAACPASSAEPIYGTPEQRRWAENLPWGLLRQGRRTDLGDFVVAQQAALERLTAERAALLAPVEGVDVDAVLRRAERLAGPHPSGQDLQDQVEAAPALARALMAERAHVREVEASEKRLMAEAEELRLTLAAEQGRAEGAPSEGWIVGRPGDYYGGLDVRWCREVTPRVHVVVAWTGTGWIWRHFGGAIWLPWHYRQDPEVESARAAMLAADAAVKP